MSEGKLEVLCNMCGKQNIQFLRCSKCKSVYYCNKKCQKGNWALHKRVCNILSVPQNQDELPFRFVNPRPDRFVSKHGNDTTGITKLSFELKTFVESHLKCDIKNIVMSSKDMSLPVGSHGQCYQNVESIKSLFGGTAVYGWQFFENEFLIEAEAHALWAPPSEYVRKKIVCPKAIRESDERPRTETKEPISTTGIPCESHVENQLESLPQIFINVTPCNPECNRIMTTLFLPDEYVKSRIFADRGDQIVIVNNVIFWKDNTN